MGVRGVLRMCKVFRARMGERELVGKLKGI